MFHVFLNVLFELFFFSFFSSNKTFEITLINVLFETLSKRLCDRLWTFYLGLLEKFNKNSYKTSKREFWKLK